MACKMAETMVDSKVYLMVELMVWMRVVMMDGLKEYLMVD